MGGVKPTWHNLRFNHSDRSEPDCLEYLNCREQRNARIERQFTAILKIGNDKRRSIRRCPDRCRFLVPDTGRLDRYLFAESLKSALDRSLDVPLVDHAGMVFSKVSR